MQGKTPRRSPRNMTVLIGLALALYCAIVLSGAGLALVRMLHR